MPGFPRVLDAVAEAYRDRREEIAAQAADITEAITKVTEVASVEGFTLGPHVLERAAGKLARRFDDEHGGFGTRPKFPNTMSLEVLLRRGALDGDTEALARVVLALDSMRAGGVYDQLGGGFHRYSTDERWLVPHFEKMLYDNALLLRLYVDAWRATKEARFAATAREIFGWVRREMTSPGGGFYATQDADSEGEEGRFFVWTPEEIDRVLEPGEAKAACATFGVTREGNGATVLSLVEPPKDEALLARAKAKLFEAREKRAKPFRDEKVMTSWNGLMIAALADAGAALGESAMILAAERAFEHVEKSLVQGDRALRHVKDGVVKGPGFLDDYAFLARASLELYEATAKASYADRAAGFAEAMIARFWDDVDASFFFTPTDGERLIHRAKDPYDHAIPSGASVALEVMARLGATRDGRYAEIAERGIQRLAPAALEDPFGMSQTILLADRLVRGAVDVVVVADPTRSLGRPAFEAYLPNRNVAWGEGAPLLAKDKPARNGAPTAYVCRGRTCSLPVTTPEELRALLKAG
jgi:uncharacterized protein YyaL (SSP411 family)